MEQFIQIQIQSSMKRQLLLNSRPQSAKPGYRVFQHQASSDDIREDERNYSRKQVKIMKPQLTTNDFARIMPKKIYHDKQRLYSEALQLKQTLNQISEENIRLKTRISILEKEKDKMNKYIESSAQSRVKLHSNKTSDKENIMVRNLKKMVRDAKDENQYLKQQNAKIKKAIKYTRINQLEIERKMLQEENQKLNRILDELNERIGDQDDYERQIIELKSFLEEEVQSNKELSQSNFKYREYVEELESKMKKDNDKFQEKEKRLQRELALQKRKLNESIKMNDDLRKQLRNVQDFKKKASRPMSSNPYSQKVNELAISMEQKKQYDNIRQKNQQLEKQLKEAKNMLQKSQSQFKEKIIVQQKKEKFSSQPNEEESYVNQPFILNEEKKVANQEDQYADQFEQQSQKKPVKDDLQEYKKDFEEQSGQAEPIYQKQEPVQKKKQPQKIQKLQKTQKTEKTSKKSKFKADKKIMGQIKQLLTYRMKAQRYPFEELKKDIDASKETNFSYSDLENMMKAQPFYLNNKFTEAFLQYVFEKQKIKNKTETITSEVFLSKVRKVIDQFELAEEEEEQEMLLRIAEMTTSYPNQLQVAFEKIKNGPETVPKNKMIEMFKKLELADQYIEIIISELTLCSEDLEHLNFQGFFQRFYIQQPSDRQPQIDEEQIQSSGEDRKRQSSNLKKKKAKKSFSNYEEYEDDKVNFILDDEAQLSMGMKGNENYDYDVVSDDGHI